MTVFQHFKLRLKERYDLDITAEEYIELIRETGHTIEYLKGEGRKVVKIQFKGKVIKCIKEVNKNKLLITALPDWKSKYYIEPNDKVIATQQAMP